jgi:hypothetical protein
MSGRPLVGTDGPLRYHSAGLDVAGQTGPSRSGALPLSISDPASYSLGEYISRRVGSWPEAVAIGDVTCDGRPDVVMTTTYYFDAANDYRVFVFPQLATGGLGAPVSYPYGATANRNGLTLADMDQNGCRDVIVGHGSGVSFLMADSTTGTLRPATVVKNGDADTVSTLDVNRDGALETLSLGWSRGVSLLYGNGYVFTGNQTLATKAAGYNDHEVGDLNGDGIPDLAVMSGQSYSVPNLSVHLHNGINALSTPPRSYFMGQSVTAGGIGLGDVNGDGRNDVVLSKPNNSPTVLWLMLQDASGNLTGPTTVPTYDIPESIEIADLDKDGDQDVVVVHGGWMKVGVYLQEYGVLKPEVLYPIPYASHYAPQGLALGDFSGDGCTDIAIADYNNGLVTLQGLCPSSL